MAIVNVGTIVVDTEFRILNPFPTLPLQSGSIYVFSLNLVPVDTSVEFVYFIVQPYFLLNGTRVEYMDVRKWYPRGLPSAFPVPVFSFNTPELDLGIGVVPIEVFKGRASPSNIRVRLRYEDTPIQP